MDSNHFTVQVVDPRLPGWESGGTNPRGGTNLFGQKLRVNEKNWGTSDIVSR